jgi:hypothetical protein
VLKPSWGVGIIVAVLVPVAVYLFNLVSPTGMLSMILLFSGLWTVIAAFAIVDRKDRSYYSGWGVVIAVLSLFYFTPSLTYTLALVILAVVALIIINVYIGKGSKIYEAATIPPAPAGETPAATAA